MAQAKTGDTVKVHYTGMTEKGEVFDSSREREPLGFTIGGGQMIRGFDQGVVGMEVGDTKKLTLSPDMAYGEHREELVGKVKKEALPEGLEVELGRQLQIKQADGQVFTAVITAEDEESITLDANHPLAGMTLVFDIELMEIA